jgi:hypothetical protein
VVSRTFKATAPDAGVEIPVRMREITKAKSNQAFDIFLLKKVNITFLSYSTLLLLTRRFVG